MLSRVAVANCTIGRYLHLHSTSVGDVSERWKQKPTFKNNTLVAVVYAYTSFSDKWDTPAVSNRYQVYDADDKYCTRMS